LVVDGSPEREHEARLRYIDGFTVNALANLGLTTQLLVLGVCLAFGVPEAYLWLAVAGLVALVPVQIRAERRVRAVF
jgi:hypothetical protein